MNNAVRRDLPIAIVDRGSTRDDVDAQLRLDLPAGAVLSTIVVVVA